MHELIRKVADEGDFFELQPAHAAQHHHRLLPDRGAHRRRRRQPADGARRRARHQQRRRRRARFVRFCDAFDIPILTFVDVPGFLPGVAQEHHGIIKNGAKLLFAYAEATVPKITVITRKAYGGAYDVMASQASARRLELRLADRRDRGDGRQGRGRDHLPQARRPEEIAEHTREYEERFANPFVAASKGFIDEVIMPHSTRRRVAMGLRKLREQAAREPVEEARQHSAVRR